MIQPYPIEEKGLVLTLKEGKLDAFIQEEVEDICPICELPEVFREGRCTICLNCGWSKCEL